LSFDFPKQVADETARLTRLQKVLDWPYLMVECDGAAQVFPMQNIKYIQAFPVPPPTTTELRDPVFQLPANTALPCCMEIHLMDESVPGGI
jgi:hypothetical protein